MKDLLLYLEGLLVTLKGIDKSEDEMPVKIGIMEIIHKRIGSLISKMYNM